MCEALLDGGKNALTFWRGTNPSNDVPAVALPAPPARISSIESWSVRRVF